MCLCLYVLVCVMCLCLYAFVRARMSVYYVYLLEVEEGWNNEDEEEGKIWRRYVRG